MYCIFEFKYLFLYFPFLIQNQPNLILWLILQ